MDWRTLRFDWNRARAFLATAEEGSLSAAARALGTTQPTIGRQVAALEAELGVALFERAGGGLVLTPAGVDLLDHVRSMGAAASRVSLAATGRSETIEGVVAITASEAYAAHLLPAAIAPLRETAPNLVIDIVASNEIRDLRRREADIAVRNAPPTDPDVIARKIGEDQAMLYAAPALLERLGRPRGPEDLRGAPFIGFHDNAPFVDGLVSRGAPVSNGDFIAVSNSHLVHWELVRAGLGVGVMSVRIGDADPAVERAAPEMAPFVFPIWLAAHRDLATSRRIRLVFDRLAAAFGREPGS